MNFIPALAFFFQIANQKKEVLNTLKDSRRMGDGPTFRKTSAPPSNDELSNEPILSARSISLDSTFKTLQYLPWDLKSWDKTKKEWILKVKIENTLPV